MQLVVLVGQVGGNLLKAGRFRPDNSIIASPLFLQFGLKKTLSGSKLVRKQIGLYGIFPVRQQNTIATPFIHAT